MAGRHQFIDGLLQDVVGDGDEWKMVNFNKGIKYFARVISKIGEPEDRQKLTGKIPEVEGIAPIRANLLDTITI